LTGCNLLLKPQGYGSDDGQIIPRKRMTTPTEGKNTDFGQKKDFTIPDRNLR